jgi:hypothetical protein
MPDPSRTSVPPLLSMPTAWPSTAWQPRQDPVACSLPAGPPGGKMRGTRHLPIEVQERPWNRSAIATSRITWPGRRPC